MLYWVFKLALFRPVVRLLWRPKLTGEENIPATGPAILVSNHLSYSDTFVLPAMIKRRLTFPAKAELFSPNSVGAHVVAWFLRNVGMLPMDRSGGRASATSMDGVRGVLDAGELLGIYPEGTRSPDGRLYKGKTGAARLVLSAGVPVVPIGMIDSQFVRNRIGIPTLKNPKIVIGTPLDFSRYAGAGNDRDVLRWVTDEIMATVQDLSGQEYADVYGASMKAAIADGRRMNVPDVQRPGAGRPAPALPAAHRETAGVQVSDPVTTADAGGAA